MTDFWIEHQTRLRRYIAQRVREPDVVDDILQQVFLKAYLNRHRLRSQASLTAWLYRIAANALVDHYRAVLPIEPLPEEWAESEPEPDLNAEQAPCLPSLLAELPEAYRLALVWSDIEGLALKTVAARLELSLSGAKSRVQRARAQLRQRLFDCCEIETGRRGMVDYQVRDPKHCRCA